MADPILLAQRSWPEVRAVLGGNQVVLVPVGAHEQHGPGIALATDTISAEVLCHRAAARLGERAAVAPAIPYGVSWHHMRFPGTISLTSRTLATVLVEVATSLARHGFPCVAFVNGHGGNSAAVALAVEEAGEAPAPPRGPGPLGAPVPAQPGPGGAPGAGAGPPGGGEAAGGPA